MENAYVEFEWNNMLIGMTYRHKKWGVIDHIELETLEPPRAPLPITETGYRSHFFHTEEMEAYNLDPEQYMRAMLDYAAQSPEWKEQQDEARQYSLF